MTCDKVLAEGLDGCVRDPEHDGAHVDCDGLVWAEDADDLPLDTEAFVALVLADARRRGVL